MSDGMAGIQSRKSFANFALGERLNGYNREGEAPTEPKPRDRKSVV